MAASSTQPGKGPRSVKPRPRRVVRRAPDPWTKRMRGLAEHPSTGWGLLIAATFAILVGAIVAWSREQPQVDADRTARQTRTVRVEFDVLNAQQTAQIQESERQKTPRVYRSIEPAIDSIISEVERLPTTASLVVATREAPADRRSDAQSLVSALNLTEAQVDALASISADAAASAAWGEKTGRLEEILRRNPLLERADWERARYEGLSRRLELIGPAGSTLEFREQAINLGDRDAFAEQARRLIASAGFEAPLADAVLAVLRQRSMPTYSYDPTTTRERQDAAAGQVQPVIDKRAIGQTIFNRGDIITPSQLLMYEQELAQYRERTGAVQLWGRRLGVGALVGICTLALAIGLITLSPRTIARPARIAWIAGLTAAAVGIGAAGTIIDPGFVALTSTAPIALIAVLMITVHDRLVAAMVGVVASLLTALALPSWDALVVVNLIGIAAVLWSLPEIRDRSSIVTMALWLAAALGIATIVQGFASLPIDQARVIEILTDGVTAGFGGLLVGGVTLFILPLIERGFSITTGMTLVELRDPKQPLMRELQQRAPGTYNHSLNVATIAESAAAAIDADTLLTYAGALYHDIGKMTKPEYFVENQSSGLNKHDRLSPAMSVLVIIGHVKDGLELAREYGLPKPLHHFIEAHHGTTLVEYFYHRAKQKAEGEEEERAPEEFEYRYPGPKPRTKEAAILMLADAVESATRSLREPTPSRIDSVVQQLANKRLMDGQFDECDLTLRELHKVVDSISKTVASIYHGRVQYPGSGEKKTA